LIASAGSGSRRLRQTQWYRRNADRNQSKFHPCNLSHIIFPPSHVVLDLSDVSFIPEYSARADLALLRARRIFQCHARRDRCSLVRDRIERIRGRSTHDTHRSRLAICAAALTAVRTN
jgi:hypothetical protein